MAVVRPLTGRKKRAGQPKKKRFAVDRKKLIEKWKLKKEIKRN